MSDPCKLLSELNAVRDFLAGVDKGALTLNVSFSHHGADIYVVVTPEMARALLEKREQELVSELLFQREDLLRIAEQIRALE